MIKVFKITNNLENVDEKLFFERSLTTNLRGHSYKLFKSFSKKLCRRTFFSQRVINYWNSLPQFVVESNSLMIFKCRLDKFMDSEDMGNKS
jgi:hypothetical protein